MLFSGSGTDTDGYLTGYNWRSSIDGPLSDQASFSSSTLSSGTHTIYFKVKDNEGSWSSEKTGTLVISEQNIPPRAFIESITPNPARYGQTILFNGYGVDEDGIVTEWKWISSIDNIISTEETFTTDDLSPGSHTIYYQVRDDNNEWSTQVSQNVIVSQNSSPIADTGGPYSGNVNEGITFNGSNSFDDGAITQYLWDFGDLTTATGKIAVHTYTSPGNYTITLKVIDDEGHNSTEETYILILQSESQPGANEGTPGFTLELPFPVIVGFEILLILSVIGLFFFWIKRR